MSKIIPQNFSEFMQRCAGALFFSIVMWSFFADSAEAKQGAASSKLCAGLGITYGDPHTAKNFLVPERHDMPEITLACVIGLAQIFFKQFEPVTYLESTYERTPEYFRKYEDRGFISKSWDNATELARSDVVFEKYYQDTYLFRIHRYFQKHPATDQDKYLLLNTTLHNQTELRDYFFMPGYQVFGPNTLRGLQDFVLKGMMKYYDQNQQNNFVTVDAEGNQRRLPTFRNLLFQLFNNLRNQTRYKECATHNSPEKLIDCERFFGAAESNKFRDAALLSKIQSVRYGIFVAGFEHFARIRQAVIDTDYKNEIAILELKKK